MHPLDGKVVALAEGRQLEELAGMLEAEGAVALRCPMLSILDAPDAEPINEWLRELIAGRFHWVIFMTGEAVRRLTGFAERANLGEAFAAALTKVSTLTRGPKPARALKELGLTPTRLAPRPTTEGVIVALQSEALAGTAVGVTLYGEPNPTLESFLSSVGAAVRTVMPYVYAPAADDGKVIDLIERLEVGSVAAVVFTSSPQIDRLFEVAQKHGLEAKLRRGLEHTLIAAIGPIVVQKLEDRGLRADVCPEHGFVMKNLVQHLKRALGS